MNPSAGKADPYWYEWNVGLEKVVEMLNSDSGIASVEFQQSGMKGWDDVVVRFRDGSAHYYQVKHTRAGNNLTFGSLVLQEKGVSLLSSLFDAWKEVGGGSRNTKFIVHTNRDAGQRASTSEDGIKRPPLSKFTEWLKKSLGDVSTISAVIPAEEWKPAWNEWLFQLNGTEQEQYDFLTTLAFDASRDDSPEIEEQLIGMLQANFTTSRDKAFGLYQGLTTGLRLWTTNRFDRPVEIEDVLQALSLAQESADEEPAPPPPAPFFSSRQTFLNDIIAALGSGPKVVFLCGEPGAGKTSLVSSLTMRRTDRSMSGLVGLRYFAYRPITVESPIIPADADKYVQPERLWYTLLSQLRRGLRGRLRQHRVPVRNDLISWSQAREHVLRIADELGRELGREFVIVVDGIDHAARASRYDSSASKGFFDSLPGPDELASKAVRLLVAGQPPAAYPEYPRWLTTDRADVRRLDVGKLDDDDIRLLLSSANAALVKAAGEAIVRLVRAKTGANTLATVFAADESRHCRTLNDLSQRLETRRLKDGLIQYYNAIWTHAVTGTESAALPLASIFFVARERVTVKILSTAFASLGLGEFGWQRMLNSLEPLLMSDKAGYRVRHNDVRVFLHSTLEGSNSVREAAMSLIFDYYRTVAPNRLAAHRSALHLARESGRLGDWPKMYSMHWVFEAASLGFAYNEQQEECAVALEEAARLRDWDVMLQVACAAETLEAWEDSCRSGSYDGLLAAEQDVAFLRSEGAVTPVADWRVSELHEVLNDVSSLTDSGQADRAKELLLRWFGGMTLAQLGAAIPKVNDGSTGIGWENRDPRRELLERVGRAFRVASVKLTEETKSTEETKKLAFAFELGWVDASSSNANAKNFDEAFAGQPPRFYGTIDKAIRNFARDEHWSLVKETLQKAPKDRSHFTKAFLARAAWRSLRAGLGTHDNPWLEPLVQIKLGLDGVEEDRVLCAMDVARALGWTKVDLDTGAIGRKVYEAEAGVERDDAKYFVAIYRAAAALGRIASTLATKGVEVTGELVPPKEVRQIAEALWGEEMHHGFRQFEHCHIAGSLATALVRQAVDLSEAHSLALLEAAAAVPQSFQLDSRKESLWELHRRTGGAAQLKAWLNRWLGADGWLWYPDTSSRESTLDQLLPLAEELGENEIARQAKERASWLRITYRGSKDHSFRPLLLWLEALGEKEPTSWRDIGIMVQTLRQAAREAGCDNEYGSEIQELLGRLAYASGPDDVRRLLLADEEARNGDDRFYGLQKRTINGAIEFASRIGTLDVETAIAIWCLVLGWTRWHDSHTVSCLNELRHLLLARVSNASQRTALERKLTQVSPGEMTRTPAPETDSGRPRRQRTPETLTGADFLAEIRAGKIVQPTAALAVVKHLQRTRPPDYDALVRQTLSQVGPVSPYGGSWYYDDQETVPSLRAIAEIVSDDQMWSLVMAANIGIARGGSAWLQSMTENLFEVLLARASARGVSTLRAGLESMGDMHERWLRGGRKTENIKPVKLPLADNTATWADAVETSLDILLGSLAGEVISSGLQAVHAWITARPDRIEHLFLRWSGDDWKANWLLVLAERWAAEHPDQMNKVQTVLETMARERVLHLRLQAWLVQLVLAASKGKNLPEFPDNPNYTPTTDVPLTVPEKELLETTRKQVGASNFVDRFGAAKGILTRVERSMGCNLSDVETNIAQIVLQLPDSERPTTFPENLHAYGDVYCSLKELGPVISAAFERKLADEPLALPTVLRFAHGYLHGEDAWLASESPRPCHDAIAWPAEKLLEPGYQVPTDRRELERICFQLATQSEVPEDEIVVGAKIDLYRTYEDFEFLFWFEESVQTNGVVSVSKPVKTISSRTFPWRFGRWFEQKLGKGNRPLVHFAGALSLLHNAGVQIVPAELWTTTFGWRPRHENPLEWVSADGIVARFERLHGPLRDARRGRFRQPLLERWIVKKTAWRAATPKLFSLRPVTILDSFPSDAEN